jgi:cell division protein ZapA
VTMRRKTNIVGLTRVTLNFMGDDYLVTGNESADYIEDLGRFLAERIREISDGLGDVKLSKTQLAVLAALQLVDDYQKVIREHEELLQLLREAK